MSGGVGSGEWAVGGEAGALGAGWHAALSEAWDAYLHGSYPVGACIVNERGQVIARGRNRLNERRAVEQGVISGHDLAHAEVNALLNLPATPRPDCYRWTLLTTLQPCPQCAAIAAMGGMRHVAYAAPDAWIADSNLLTHDPYVSRKGVRVSRAPEHVQRAALRLVLVSHLEDGQDLDSPMLRSFAHFPDDVHAAATLHASNTLATLRDQRSPLAGALAVLA